MEELLIPPHSAIVLLPGERIEAGDEPLRIRAGTATSPGTHAFNNSERTLWESQKRATGDQTAVYRRGEETRLIRIAPESPNAEAFGFAEGGRLATTVRVFKIEKADLNGWLPQAGDTLDYQEKIYTFRKGAADSFYQDLGNHNVMMRIFVSEYRGQ